VPESPAPATVQHLFVVAPKHTAEQIAALKRGARKTGNVFSFPADKGGGCKVLTWATMLLVATLTSWRDPNSGGGSCTTSWYTCISGQISSLGWT